jgi:thioredoxin reductase/bacterioferritin-associated ferredoxin
VTLSYDVAVIGGGPAGLSAARAAASAGARTVCVDRYALAGGQYYRQPMVERTGLTRRQRHGRDLAAAAVAAGADHLPDTTVWAVSVNGRDRRIETIRHGVRGAITATSIVIAGGAHERVAAFPGWTLPGVMTVGGIQAQLKAHGQLPGRRAVIAGSGPLPLVVAGTLATRGVRVAALLEAARPARRGLANPVATATAMLGQPGKLAEAVRHVAALARHGTRPRTGWGIVRAHGTDRVEAATVARLDRGWHPVPGTEIRLACDVIGIHYGLVPDTGLCQLLGAELDYRPDLGGYVPRRTETMRTTVAGVFAAGDGAGVGGVTLALIEGEIAGRAAAAHAAGRPFDAGGRPRRRLANARRFQALYGRLYTPGAGLAALPDPDTVICRCEAVTLRDIDAAIRRGARTHAGVKSLTRCGMGNCQGAICASLVRDILVTGGDAAPTPVTTRPPAHPVALAALTGPKA